MGRVCVRTAVRQCDKFPPNHCDHYPLTTPNICCYFSRFLKRVFCAQIYPPSFSRKILFFVAESFFF